VLQDTDQAAGTPSPLPCQLHRDLLDPRGYPLEPGNLGGQHRQAGNQELGHTRGVASIDVPPVLANPRDDLAPAKTQQNLDEPG